MDDGFFTGYRRTILRPQEVLVSIEIPYSKKVDERRHDTSAGCAPRRLG